MYYPDLTPRVYLKEQMVTLPEEYQRLENPPLVLRIGWLEAPHPFPIGETSEEFRDQLFELGSHPVNLTRGWHSCDFCLDIPHILRKKIHADGTEIIHDFGPEPIAETRNGKKLGMGNGEIWVPGKESIVYAAPTLIYHYVVAHNYLPPAAFIEAVLESCGGETKSI